MTLVRVALLNWGRRKLRTGISVAGVAIAIAAAFSLLAFHRGYQAGMRAEVDRLGAHVLVVPKGCPYDAASIALHGAKWPCYLKEAYLGEVRAASTVSTAAPVFMSALYDDAGQQWVYSGVTADYLRLKPGWRIQGRFPRPGEVLTGRAEAKRRGWGLGSMVRLPGLTGHRARVAGLLEPTGGADDAFVYLPLPDAQRLFRRRGELTHILVRLRHAEDMDAAVAQMRSCGVGGEMNVVPLAHLFQTIQALTGSAHVLLTGIALVALLIAAAGVGNAMLMAVSERRSEIGTLRALGASRGDVFRLIWTEALSLCLLGGVLGVGVAFAGSSLLETWLRGRLPFAPVDALIQWDPGIAAVCLLTGAVVGSVAGLLPAWKACTLPPARAIAPRW